METHHTGGPWTAVFAETTNGKGFWDIRQPGRFRGFVGTVMDAEHIGGMTQAEATANAHLIAAAPEMLVALRQLVKLVGDALQDDFLDATTDAGGILCGDIMGDALHEAQIAIAKATASPSSSPEIIHGNGAAEIAEARV